MAPDLERFFKILTDGIHRFEGTVNQYTGGGIMALFGAPITHEDHAQRACYAALSLQEDLHRYANELRVEKGISFQCESLLARYGSHLRRITVAPRRRPLRRPVRGRARPC